MGIDCWRIQELGRWHESPAWRWNVVVVLGGTSEFHRKNKLEGLGGLIHVDPTLFILRLGHRMWGELAKHVFRPVHVGKDLVNRVDWFVTADGEDC